MAHDHGDRLCKVASDMPRDERLCDLADLFKIFGDSMRIKILYGLFESELCVCTMSVCLC